MFFRIFATFAIFAKAVMDFVMSFMQNLPGPSGYIAPKRQSHKRKAASPIMPPEEQEPVVQRPEGLPGPSPAVLRNLLGKEPKKLLFADKKGLECISPLIQSVEETPQPIATEITGTIPKWICGRFLRVGPGKFEFGSDKYNHWFDGLALLHQFKIEQGTVTYMSKFLESESYLTNSRRNRIMISEFGTLAVPDPCKTMFERFMSTFDVPKVTDNDNVNYVRYKGDYYVSTETNFMHRIDPKTLETKDKVDWSKYIAVNGATAHPHYDPDGTVYNMGNSYGKYGSRYNIICVPPQKVASSETLEGAEVVCSIAHKNKLKPSYYHSFGMTENYIIFVEQPLKMDLLKIITQKISGKTVADSLTWEPEENTYFHIANKLSGKLLPVKYCAKGFAMFHHINAFEDHGCIVLDICCQDRGDGVHFFTLQNMRQSGEALDEVYNSISNSFPRRFVLPLALDVDTPEGVDLNPVSYTSATAVRRADGSVWCTYEKLHDDVVKDIGGFDFPVINYAKYNTKKYRFFYGVGIGHLVGNSLIKMDAETKMAKVWRETSFYPSEPVFVPLPDATAEDEGVILSVVVTPNKNKNTFLLVLDARTFAEIGRAEVHVQIPSGFHGVFAAN